MDLVDAYDAILLDLDGTLYRGGVAIPGAPETVADVRARGKSVVFLTNNSGRSRAAVADKLERLGFQAAPEDVVSSAVATAEALVERGVARVFAACGEGLQEEMTNRGITVEMVLGVHPPDAVVVGFDAGSTYERLRDACLAVQRGAALIASNADASFPAEDGLWPGAGALLSVITVTTGATPEVMGKPAAPLFVTALKSAGGGCPLVVGDRLDTDIAGAQALGWDSLLVRTGVSEEAHIGSAVRPTWLGDDVSALCVPGVPA